MTLNAYIQWLLTTQAGGGKVLSSLALLMPALTRKGLKLTRLTFRYFKKQSPNSHARRIDGACQAIEYMDNSP